MTSEARSPDRKRAGRWLVTMVCLGLPLNLAAAPTAPGAQPKNALPQEVVAALQNPDAVTLYAIEPEGVLEFDPDFHRYPVLGTARIDAPEARRVLADLQASLARPNGGPAMCFEPHHRINVRSGAHSYDLVICYLCGGLRVYRDGTPIAGLLLAGTPELLNELAATHGLPKPQVLTRDEFQRREMERALDHWLTVMPSSIKPLWTRDGAPAHGVLEAALAREFPDERQRILALFAWYASGTGRWSGYPAYEEVPAELLRRYPFSELSRLAQSDALTDLQLKGAARFFASWNLGHQETGDRSMLRRALREHFRVTDEWMTNMPRSLRPLWKDSLWYDAHLTDADRDRMVTALAQELGDRNQQILSLLGWYGSGVGMKCGCANYEYVVQDLLLKFSTADLLAAVQSQPLTEKQLDGAARLLADWYFQRERPHEIEGFPTPVKSMLLAHIQRRRYSDWLQYSAPFK